MLIYIILIILILLVTTYEKFEQGSPDNQLNIYIINLKSRPDRLIKATHMLDEHNLKYNVVEAINGQILNISNSKLRRGEIGCYLSHIKCWKQILSNNSSYGIVMEDDVIFKPDFNKKLNKILKNAGNNWDIICLGRNCNPKYGFGYNCRNKGEYITDNIMYPKILGYGTACYIINKKGIRKLLSDTFPITEPVDVVIMKKYNSGELNVLGLKDDLITIRNYSDSDTIAIK